MLVCLRADRDGRGRAGGLPEGLKGEHSQRKAGGEKRVGMERRTTESALLC